MLHNMRTPYIRTGGLAPATAQLTPAERQALRHADAAARAANLAQVAHLPRRPRGLGNVIEGLIKPVARVLGLSCLDSTGRLKPDSPCARRRDALNRKTGLSYHNLR